MTEAIPAIGHYHYRRGIAQALVYPQAGHFIRL